MRASNSRPLGRRSGMRLAPPTKPAPRRPQAPRGDARSPLRDRVQASGFRPTRHAARGLGAAETVRSTRPAPVRAGVGEGGKPTLRQTRPRPRTWAQSAFKDSMVHIICNSHYVSHFAAFFIVAGAKISVVESCHLVGVGRRRTRHRRRQSFSMFDRGLMGWVGERTRPCPGGGGSGGGPPQAGACFGASSPEPPGGRGDRRHITAREVWCGAPQHRCGGTDLRPAPACEQGGHTDDDPLLGGSAEPGQAGRGQPPGQWGSFCPRCGG